jgi:cytochrome oxidase Cu insertion factor (SCO1/SenC/PrrC family)
VIARILATVLLAGLLALDLALPYTGIGRRGTGPARNDVASAVGEIGQPLPDFSLLDLDGQVVRLSDLRGHRVLLTFERSVDW